MVTVAIDNASKSYTRKGNHGHDKVQVLENLSFSVGNGEFVTLFGANGCGKTTLLKIIAGFDSVDNGRVRVDSLAPGEVKTGFIFQNYADSLLPWKRVVDNIALPLSLKGFEQKAAREKVEQLLGELNLELPLSAFPYQLSAGQQQMVAIARALAYESELLLLDEPFSSLDFQTRVSLQQEILRIWQNRGMTVLFVSHDIEEALFLADRLILLTNRPAKVKEIIRIELPRPRSQEVFESSEFSRLKVRTTKSFFESISECEKK